MTYGLKCTFLIATCLILLGESRQILKSENTSLKSADLKTMVTIGDEVFYFATGFSKYETWYAAELKCQELQMQLVTLDTEERWTMISDFIEANPSFDNWLWTSGRRLPMAEEFVWVTTGNTFNYTDWNPAQPSRNFTLEACVNFHAGYNGWDDDDCTGMTLMYMCESRPVVN